jgi:hypothetical protein
MARLGMVWKTLGRHSSVRSASSCALGEQVGDKKARAGGEPILDRGDHVAVLRHDQLGQRVGVAEEAAGGLVVLDSERCAGQTLIGKLARFEQRERRQSGALLPGHVDDRDRELVGGVGGTDGCHRAPPRERRRQAHSGPLREAGIWHGSGALPEHIASVSLLASAQAIRRAADLNRAHQTLIEHSSNLHFAAIRPVLVYAWWDARRVRAAPTRFFDSAVSLVALAEPATPALSRTEPKSPSDEVMLRTKLVIAFLGLLGPAFIMGFLLYWGPAANGTEPGADPARAQ